MAKVERGAADVDGSPWGDDADARDERRLADDEWWDEITWDAREAREGASGR